MRNTISLAEVVTADDLGFHRPTYARVEKNALAKNFSAFRNLAGSAKIMAVVKADAYGHGLFPCAKLFAELGADYFGVGFVEEGIALRRRHFTEPILVLGGIVGSQIALFLEHDLDMTASSVFKMEAIEREAAAAKKTARVHLKIDTGMNRIGQNFRTVEALFQTAKNSKHIKIVGIYSHLATAEEGDMTFAKLQIERFHQVVEQAKSIGLDTGFRHIANSAAAIHFPDSRLDMIRPGIGLFGQHARENLQKEFKLEPALSLRSEIVYTKRVRKGEGVSYNLRWTAPEDLWIATIPVGYGDGYLRFFSNKSHALIGGKRYPVVGTICMDQLMVNLDQDRYPVGEEVMMWGKQGDEEITLWELCNLGGYIPYELPIYLTGRVPRVFV